MLCNNKVHGSNSINKLKIGQNNISRSRDINHTHDTLQFSQIDIRRIQHLTLRVDLAKIL